MIVHEGLFIQTSLNILQKVTKVKSKSQNVKNCFNFCQETHLKIHFILFVKTEHKVEKQLRFVILEQSNWFDMKTVDKGWIMATWFKCQPHLVL